MAAARHVGMGKLVNNNQLWLSSKDAVNIKLCQFNALIGNFCCRKNLEPSKSRSVSFRPCVTAKPMTTSTPSFFFCRAPSSME